MESALPLRSVFVGHGAPTLALTDLPGKRFLEELGAQSPRPRALIVISPHWQTVGVTIKSAPQFQAWHDFSGFPDELYQLRYAPRGDAALAASVGQALRKAGFAPQVSADTRIDHGVWVPLLLMYPQADIPLVQVSVTHGGPDEHFRIGRVLRDLAGAEVLIVGSGSLVHNLREVQFDDTATPEWAQAFDDWMTQQLLTGDWDRLCHYRQLAPAAARAHPTDEHLMPLFVAGGAGARAEVLHRSFSLGSLSMAAYGFR